MACLILETVTQSYLTTKVLHGIKRKSLYVKKQKNGNHNWFEKIFHYLGGKLINVMKLRLMLLLIFSFMTFLRFSKVWKSSRSGKVLCKAHYFTDKDNGVIEQSEGKKYVQFR